MVHTQKSTKFINRHICSLWLAQSSSKVCIWLHIPTLYLKWCVYTDFPPHFKAVPQRYLKGCLLSFSTHFAPNSQLSKFFSIITTKELAWCLTAHSIHCHNDGSENTCVLYVWPQRFGCTPHSFLPPCLAGIPPSSPTAFLPFYVLTLLTPQPPAQKPSLQHLFLELILTCHGHFKRTKFTAIFSLSHCSLRAFPPPPSNPHHHLSHHPTPLGHPRAPNWAPCVI